MVSASTQSCRTRDKAHFFLGRSTAQSEINLQTTNLCFLYTRLQKVKPSTFYLNILVALFRLQEKHQKRWQRAPKQPQLTEAS